MSQLQNVKYGVHGGYVISRHDGQSHYVYPQEVMSLYGVEPKDCLMIRDDAGISLYDELFLTRLIHLYPDASGRYELKENRNDQ